MENIDAYVMNMRSELYKRSQAFVKMAARHKNKECKCLQQSKQCNCNGILDLDRFNDPDYILEELQSGKLEAMFNIILSVTNSLKSKAGYDFEQCIIEVLDKNNINYAKQIPIGLDGIILNKKGKNKCHSVDLMIPPAIIGTNIKDYRGDIVSVKTTPRERYLQDKYLCYSCRLVLISLEEVTDNKIISIKVDPDERNLHNYIMSLNTS